MMIAYEYAARVALRYGLGALGLGGAERLASDPDAVALVALGLSAVGGWAVERWTRDARAKGRKT